MSVSFKNVGVQKVADYLKPGVYNVLVKDVTLTEEGVNNPYLEILFESDMGQTSARFNLKGNTPETTEMMLERLNSLHFGWFGKPVEKDFTSYKDVETYFKKALTTFNKKRAIVVIPEQGSDGKTYAKLAFSRFVLPDLVEEGPWAEDSAQYKANFKANKNARTVTASDATMLPDTGNNKNSSDDDSDDLPF